MSIYRLWVGADHPPEDDRPDEDACACATCRDPRPASERLAAALRHLETFAPSDPQRQRIEGRMATVKALRYRPVLWRQGQARD